MNHSLKVVLRIVIGLLLLATIGVLAEYVVLRPIRAISSGASVTAEIQGDVPINSSEITNEGMVHVECFDDCTIFARDAALLYMYANYGNQAPAPDLIWEQTSMSESTAPEGELGEVSYEYTAGRWTLIISYSIRGSEPAEYTVEVDNQDSDYDWEGTVDVHAHVTE
jgi:hypothetical protein